MWGEAGVGSARRARSRTCTRTRHQDFHVESDEDQTMLVRVIIHSADLANPILPPARSLELTLKVTQEFKRQAEREAELGIPVTAFMKVEVCACVRVRGCVCVRVRARARGCVCAHARLTRTRHRVR